MTTRAVAKKGKDGARSITLVAKSGVYELMFTSRKPEAERFKDWLKYDVLEALRKIGLGPAGACEICYSSRFSGRAADVHVSPAAARLS